MRACKVRVIAYKKYLLFPSLEEFQPLAKVGVPYFKVFQPPAVPRLKAFLQECKISLVESPWIDVYHELCGKLQERWPRSKVKGNKLILTADTADELQGVLNQVKNVFRYYSVRVDTCASMNKRKLASTLVKLVFDPHLDSTEPTSVDAHDLAILRLGGYQFTIQSLERTATTPKALHLRWSSASDKEIEVVWSHSAVDTPDYREALRKLAWELLNSSD